MFHTCQTLVPLIVVTLVFVTEQEVELVLGLFFLPIILRNSFLNLDPTIQYKTPLMMWLNTVLNS